MYCEYTNMYILYVCMYAYYVFTCACRPMHVGMHVSPVSDASMHECNICIYHMDNRCRPIYHACSHLYL